MKQVIQNTRTGKLRLAEVPAPRVKAGNLLVRTRASLISAGTERMAVDFARKSLAGKARQRPDLVKKVLDKAKRDGIAATFRSVMARLDEPLPLGYSAAGDIIAVGEGLEGVFRTGQRVAVAGAGLANHAELNVVPANLASPIPDDVDYREACFGTLTSIAMHAVRNLNGGLGDTVAVIGTGLLGQLIVSLLTLSGVRVLALDYNQERLTLAIKMGAEATCNLGGGALDDTVAALTGGRGCDGVIISAATSSSEPFQVAGTIARDRARVCMVGLTGTEFPYREFMQKELNLVVSRSYGPGRYDPDYEGRGVKYPEGWVRWTETENLGECVRLMSPSLERRLDVGALTTHTFDFDDAESAYELVTGGGEPHLGVVLRYAKAAGEAVGKTVSLPAATGPAGGCVLGVIGAGNFARAVLLPEFKKIAGVTLHMVATQRGATAEHAGSAFGFAHTTTDIDAVLANPEINAVLIATRHDSHAELCARALEAGKSVLVEKPLGLSRRQINRVITARNASEAFFQIGFNRRFAPLAVKMRRHLAARSGPKFLVLRVNAGQVAADSWVHEASEGGGRILGEVCHFVDLARYLVGSPILSVQADAGVTEAACDDVSIALRFADGSLATIAYTGLGDSAFSKERIEAFAGGTVMTIDDFRSGSVTENGKTTTSSGRAQDKGFKPGLKAFVTAVKNGGPAVIDEAELIETSLATIAIMESLRAGQRIDV